MHTNQPGRVIITSARSIMALIAANSLGKKGIEVIGADCVEVTMLTFSKHVHQHEIYSNYLFEPENFLEDLQQIIKKNKPADNRPYVLMPIFKETNLIVQHKELFEADITVATPQRESLSKVHPKHHFARTAQYFQVKTPETFLPENKKELEELDQKIQYPVLIKPYDESGGKGIKKIKDFQNLKQAFNDNINLFGQPPLIQKLSKGEDYCFTGLFQEGELKASMAYKNLQRFPAESGSGVMRETIDDSPFINEAKKLMEPIHWNGIAQIDFIWSGEPDDAPDMIEVNPRFFAGLFQSVDSGIDYPWLNYLLFTGKIVPEAPKANIGQKTKIPLAWALAAMQDSIQLDDSIEDLKHLLQTTQKQWNNNHNLLSTIRNLFNGQTTGVRSPLNLSKLQESIKSANEADNEVFLNDDPTASMGVIYSLLYWFKYKKLPPEVGI